jgi:hypothetical protein
MYMSSTVKPSKAKILAGLLALVAGTQKHFPTGSLTIGNATFAPAALIALLQSLINALLKRSAALVSARDSLTELRAVQVQVDPVVQGYRDLLVAMFGQASQMLADFGLSPRKVRAPLTVEQKAAAKAKAEATRKARGTKGPKAKLAIKGTAAVPAAEPAAPVAPTPKSPG